MAKKNPEVNVETGEVSIPDFDNPTDFTPDSDFSGVEDFNTETDYKPIPLIPKGKYRGNVTKVIYNPETVTIEWTVTLAGNEERVMMDGESPVDGATLGYKNWLPKPGDENEMTSTGRQTKRQAKINMLADFGKELGIDVSTPKAILSAISNAEWIGLAVIAEVGFRTWESRTFNDLKRLAAA